MPQTIDDIYETRRQNLTNLLREPGAKTQLASRLGSSQAHITHLLKPPTAASARAIREETARQIEDIMGLDRGRLDQPNANLGAARTDAAKGRALIVKETQSAVLIDARNQIAHGAPDPALLEEAFKQVLEALQQRELQLPADKTAKMARLVYEQGLATGRIDPSLVLSLLSLMA